jgi:hypothetical protein
MYVYVCRTYLCIGCTCRDGAERRVSAVSANPLPFCVYNSPCGRLAVCRPPSVAVVQSNSQGSHGCHQRAGRPRPRRLAMGGTSACQNGGDPSTAASWDAHASGPIPNCPAPSPAASAAALRRGRRTC